MKTLEMTTLWRTIEFTLMLGITLIIWLSAFLINIGTIAVV